MMMMMRRLASLRVRAKPTHLPYICLYMYIYMDVFGWCRKTHNTMMLVLFPSFPSKPHSQKPISRKKFQFMSWGKPQWKQCIYILCEISSNSWRNMLRLARCWLRFLQEQDRSPNSFNTWNSWPKWCRERRRLSQSSPSLKKGWWPELTQKKMGWNHQPQIMYIV